MPIFAQFLRPPTTGTAVTFGGATTKTTSSAARTSIRLKFRTLAFLNKPSVQITTTTGEESRLPTVVYNSLRVLEWDKVCDSVASFAGTSFGQLAIKEQLWCLDKTYEESLRLLEQTNAAVEMHKHGGCVMDFTCLDFNSVKSAIQDAQRGIPVDGREALALVAVLEYADSLQLNMKAAIKEDSDWLLRFMPLSEIILDLVVSRPLTKFILQLIDGEGCVKDTASPALKKSRQQVRLLETKLYQLMDRLIRNEMNERPSVEVSNSDGRWCIKLGADVKSSFDGLLLSSGSGSESIIEPLSAVPLNDELQQARASVAKAEADVLLEITNKMQADLVDIENLFDSIVRLDVINARATYSISFGATFPELFLPEDKEVPLTSEALLASDNSIASHPTQKKWKIYMPKAYHPILLHRHRKNLRKAMKEVNDATADIKRRKQQAGNASQGEETNARLSSLKLQVSKLEEASPVPVDIFIDQKTKVLVITGPNTGGKTIFLKTVGLAAMMAKSGIYVLACEPVKIPWFDFVFADIGDEQSLSQSLSTFSGHLKQTSDIRAHSTSRSLVLLDEVGAGTNPLEGAALGMSLLESFAEGGVLLTIATTHHGELKTLKYSNNAFENACMEFDEVNLKPTYRILWGVPGRSNAINIAERLGLPKVIVDNARDLHGAASAEINEIIVDMENNKQNFHKHISETRHYLKLSRELHRQLMVTRRKIDEHAINQRYVKMQEITKAGALARSALHKKLRERRASRNPTSSKAKSDILHNASTPASLTPTVGSSKASVSSKTTHSSDDAKQSPSVKKVQLPKAGDMVHVLSLKKKATVLKVEPSKDEIVVQAGNMKLKLSLADVS